MPLSLQIALAVKTAVIVVLRVRFAARGCAMTPTVTVVRMAVTKGLVNAAMVEDSAHFPHLPAAMMDRELPGAVANINNVVHTSSMHMSILSPIISQIKVSI